MGGLAEQTPRERGQGAILAAYRDGKPRLVRKLTEKHLTRSAAELRHLAARR
jgi:hypothetical protein